MLFHIMFLDYFESFFFFFYNFEILLLQTNASDNEEREHDTNDDLERETTSEVGDTQCDGE